MRILTKSQSYKRRKIKGKGEVIAYQKLIYKPDISDI